MTNKKVDPTIKSLFSNLNLSDARMEGEDRAAYKLCRKRNNHIIKLYKKFGREAFQQAFPEGVTETSIEQLIADREKAIEEVNKNIKNG